MYDCTKCFRRFGSLNNHKTTKTQCGPEDIIKVEHPESRASLPLEIKAALKPKVLPSRRDLEIAERFVQYKSNLAKCSGEHRRWSQDRGGIIKLMGQMFNMTSGLRKPEALVKGCLELKETRGLKPQTMLNYLSTFLLFVKYCYLAGETNTKTPGLDQERMMTALQDARKAFSPAAAEDYRVTSDAMRELVPPVMLFDNDISKF